jgi:WD40 repeat protein
MIRPDRRAWSDVDMPVRFRRLRSGRRLLTIAILVVTVGAVALAATAQPERSALIAGTVGLLIAGANLLVDVVAAMREPASPTEPAELADELARAVGEQWRAEAARRGLREADILPLSWSLSQRSRPDARILGSRADGRLSDNFPAATAQLAESFRRLPLGRLVVLGEPGAGKSVLVLMLTVGLIESRAAGSAVPVLVSVSSWDPIQEDLDDWLVASLAATYYNGERTVPLELLRSGLLLPVLDGVDEIPETSRRAVVQGIHKVIRDDRPIVLTCRSTEYRELILGGSPALSSAPAIEVDPIAPADLAHFLGRQQWPAGVDWQPVLADLEARPDGPVALALSTPLSVSLAVLVYQRLAVRPVELLEPARFASRFSIDDHLAALAAPAAYAVGPDASPRDVRQAARARTHLAYLAKSLHSEQERDLAWWRIANRSMPSWAVPTLGMGGGLLLALAVAAGIGRLDPDVPFVVTLCVAGGVGLLFAILTITVWFIAGDLSPQRLSWRLAGSGGRWRQGFLTGMLAVAIPGVPVVIVVALTIGLTGSWSLRYLLSFCQLLGGIAGGAAVLGAAVAIQRWLSGGQDRAVSADPLVTIRDDRRYAMVCVLAAGLVVGVLGAPAVIGGMWLAAVLFGALTDTAGWPGVPGGGRLLEARFDDVAQRYFESGPVRIGALAVLPAVLVMAVTLLTHAWPRYVVTSLFLAVRRQLPVRLTQFLADAQDRGLLRRSGVMYQFRHARLQEQLAARGTPAGVSPKPGTTARRRLVPAVAVAATVLLLAAFAFGVQRDGATVTLAGAYGDGPYRPVFSNNGAYVALCSPGDTAVRFFRTANGDLVGTVPAGADRRGCDAVRFAGDDDAVLVVEDSAGDEPYVAQLWSFPGLVSLHTFLPADSGNYDEDNIGFALGTHMVTVQSTPVQPRPYRTIVQVWDYRAPDKPRLDLKLTSNTDLAWAAGNTALANYGPADDDHATLWQVATAAQIPASKGRALTFIEFSPDGRWAATTDTAGLSLWDLAGGREIRTGLAVSSDNAYFDQASTRLLVESSEKTTVSIVDLTSGKVSASVTPSGPVYDLVVADSGDFFATMTESRQLQVWQADGHLLRDLGRLPAESEMVGFGQGGGFLSALFPTNPESDSELARLRVWPLIPPGPEFTVPDTFSSSDMSDLRASVAELADLAPVPSTSDGPVAYWSVRQGRRVVIEARPDLSVIPDNRADRLLAFTDKDGYVLYDTAGATRALRHIDNVGAPALQLGPYLATVHTDDVVRLWDPGSGLCVARLAGHTSTVHYPVLDEQGTMIATGSADNTVRLWNVADALRRGCGH